MQFKLVGFLAWQLSAKHVERSNWTYKGDGWAHNLHVTVDSSDSLWEKSGKVLL